LSLDTRKVTLQRGRRADDPIPGDYVCLRAIDTGTGMTPDVLAQAFEPYFTTKPSGSGSGLGLSQVAAVARQYGGLARIESTPASGTSVEVLLPCAQISDDQIDAPTGITSMMTTAAPTGRANVLVVDDDVDVRSTTALLLRRMGYAVTTAGNAAEALHVLDSRDDIELLLSDVVMPQVTGPDLARQAQARRPDLPVVFFSGYADPEAIAGAIPLARLLRKPFRPTELAKLIETALAEARSGGTVAVPIN
jgi:CheY-like chemotaxis protein